MSGWSILIYNNGGNVQQTVNLSGVIPNQSGGFGTLAFAVSGLAASNTAWALVNGTTLIEFISPSGTVTGASGAAAGFTSTAIGPVEGNTTADTQSLQRTGSGYDSSSFTWQAPATSSFGSLNSGQTMTAHVVNGTPGDDTGATALIGLDTVDEINGGDGNDSLQGRQGMDTLNGGLGNDVLSGGAGADTMIGGGGNDIYAIDNVGDVVTELSGEGTDEVRSIFDVDLNNIAFANIENLRLQGTAINGTGNSGANVITGNASDNTLSGGGGNDTIRGGAGADIIYGDGDNDTIYGEAGTDTIYGGAGKDTMWGGADGDDFFFGAGDFAGLTASTADRIRDFNSSEGDNIDLTASPGLTFNAGTTFSGTAPEVLVQQFAADGAAPYSMVFIDTDGNGTADHAIRVDGAVNLSASDFYL
jgi:Ca2+-binding RTX toxin-like protein